MGYKYREDLTAADVAFVADGNTIEELFQSAAMAITNTMIDDPGKLGTGMERKVSISAANEERLLHDFLDELVYFKDAEMLLFREFDIRITEGKKEGKRILSLEAVLKGDEIGSKGKNMIVDVKAVSWHKFELKRSKSGWKATVIVDV